VDAPYERRTGRYAYHHTRLWGDPVQTSEEGYVLGYASEQKTWRLADGSATVVTTALPPQFPDRASRDYWLRHLEERPGVALAEGPVDEPPSPNWAPLPADRAGVVERLKISAGGGAAAKEVMTLYTWFAVPKRTRAMFLQVLAEVPGYRWRGEVTDRAGRRGMAITYDDREHGQQTLLIFDGRTGELLAHELVTETLRVTMYQMILETDRVDRPA